MATRLPDLCVLHSGIAGDSPGNLPSIQSSVRTDRITIVLGDGFGVVGVTMHQGVGCTCTTTVLDCLL